MEVIFFVLVLIISVVVHEVSHGYAAYALGDPTAKLAGRLTLNPLPHIDPIGSILVPGFLILLNPGFIFGWAKPVPYNPHNLKAPKWGPALVALAGPASNLLIAFVFGLAVRFLDLPINVLETLAFVVLMNIALAIFNLIPIPPLDGSKVLFSALPYNLRYVEEFMTRYQIFLIAAVILMAEVIVLQPLQRLRCLWTGL